MKLLEFLGKHEYSTFSFKGEYYSGKHLYGVFSRRQILMDSDYDILLRGSELETYEQGEDIPESINQTGIKIVTMYKKG